MAIEPLKFYKTEEVAAELGISRRSVWNLIKRGELKARQIGRRRYFVLGSDILAMGTEEPKEDKRVVARKQWPGKKASGTLEPRVIG